MDIEEMARLHKALSAPVRLQILALLSERPLCVNAITRSVDISQPAVSQHLAVLKQAGLVAGEKQGYMVHYSLNRTRLDQFRAAVTAFPGSGDEKHAARQERHMADATGGDSG